MGKNDKKRRKYRPKKYNKFYVCSDECENCMYIGEGSFFCAIADEIVISDWEPTGCLCPLQTRQ